ncbi:MAG: hypothetical protein KDI06_05710 [Calditrichaeota bacterium]|nr:hypothetical protein [Calditrichota bacterium]HQU71517.1 hypothetical protein [Calditrichia bacterium]
MLDQIIDNIIQKIRAEVVQKGMNDIPLTYIFTRNIPDSIKHFFDQEVEIWIREERDKFGSSERFDYEMPEVQMLIDKVFDILKQTATFHINQFNRLLERAIKLQANYLIRPHQTLTQFLFKDSFVVTTIEVYDMLKYFDKFQYYKDALTDYFNLKYLREISQTQFEELISAIDQQVFSKNPAEAILQTVKTINNFINEGRKAPTEIVTTRMLAMVFRDRNLADYVQLIEKEIKQGTKEVTLEQLEQILITGKTLRDGKKEAVQGTVASLPDIEKDKPEVAVEDIQVTREMIIPDPEELEEEVYEEEIEEEEVEEPEAPTPPPPAPKPQPMVVETHAHPGESAADQLADLVGSKMKGENLENLTRLVTPKQRKIFIKKIFKKKEAQYNEFVNLINNTPSWKAASNLIDSFFYQQGLNPYSKEALEFSDLIYNRYFPKDISVNKGEEFRY